jgi:hypothetical protein
MSVGSVLCLHYYDRFLGVAIKAASHILAGQCDASISGYGISVLARLNDMDFHPVAQAV